jgi:hypothetical protein
MTNVDQSAKLGDSAQQEGDSNIWDRFSRIETERFIYSPAEAAANGNAPLVGYLLNRLEMPPIQMKKDEAPRPWSCFLVKITEPAMVLDREKDPILAKKGSEVLIPATYQLAQHFQRPSQDPAQCWEIIVEPNKKVEIGKGGQSLWLFNLGWNPNNPKPRASFGFAAKLNALPEGQSSVAALPEGQVPKTIDTDGTPVAVEAAGRATIAENPPFGT